MAVTAGSVVSVLLLLGCADLEQAETAADKAGNADSLVTGVRPASMDTALTVEYDRFEDHTSVTSPLIAGDTYHIGAQYECEGSPGCRPDHVTFRLIPEAQVEDTIAMQTKEMRDENPFLALDTLEPQSGPSVWELIFLVDGKRRFDVVERARAEPRWDDFVDSMQDVESSFDRYLEQLGNPDWGIESVLGEGFGAARATVPFEVFRTMAEASKVEFRLNNYEASLTAKQVAVLHRMTNLVQDSR